MIIKIIYPTKQLLCSNNSNIIIMNYLFKVILSLSIFLVLNDSMSASGCCLSFILFSFIPLPCVERRKDGYCQYLLFFFIFDCNILLIICYCNLACILWFSVINFIILGCQICQLSFIVCCFIFFKVCYSSYPWYH